MKITIPTTPAEWNETDYKDGPFLLVSRDREGLARWVGVNPAGECESFDTLDGALLFAVGFIDRGFPDHRALYDQPGAAKLWFDRQMRRFEAEAKGDPGWESVQ